MKEQQRASGRFGIWQVLAMAAGSAPATACSGARRTNPTAVLRRRWRKPFRRVAFVGVVLITNFSLLLNQTQAYLEIERQIQTPDRVVLGATTWDYVSSAVSNAIFNSVYSLGRSALLFLSNGQSRPVLQSPAGRPHPWQASAPAAPFTLANMANGNLFTEVPVVNWQPVGRPMSFALFHSSLGNDGPASDMATLFPKWRHSFSRSLEFDEGEGDWTLYPDEGGSIRFTPQVGEPDTFVPPAGFHSILRTYAGLGLATLTYKNQDVDVFDIENGRLDRLEDATGNISTLTYEPDPIHGGERLAKITDASANELVLEYDVTSGRLIEVTAPPIGPLNNRIERRYSIGYVVPETPSLPKILKVSTARRTAGGEPLFWAEFHAFQYARIIRIVDFPIGFDEQGNPMPGPATIVTYNADGRVNLVTLADGFPEEQTRSFGFFCEGLETGPGFGGARMPAPINCEVVTRATVLGSRTMPGPDVTTYNFDDSGRLVSVLDPLGRVTAGFEWDSDNNPISIRNVYGGATTQTFDENGNVLTVQPPVGGPYEYRYDALNNLTYVKDPLGYETNTEHVDGSNPTRPTRIDGPGVSDITLQWGQGLDAIGMPAYDRGKLLRTESPNRVEQTFAYWTPPGGVPSPDDRYGRGQMYESTHGRGDAPPPVGLYAAQDRVIYPDSTGIPNTTREDGEDGGENCEAYGREALPCWAPPEAMSGGAPEQPSPTCIRPKCADSEECNAEYDADANVVDLCVCGFASRSTVPARYNGKGQPISLPQPEKHWNTGEFVGEAGWRFVYDAHGRKTLEEAVAVEDWERPQLEPHLRVYMAHIVSWTYNDATGTTTRLYDRPNDPPVHPGPETPITTITETDLAGRVTAITQNGATTEYAYYDDVEVLPAVVETKPDNTASEYYVNRGGQIRKIVHRDALAQEVLAFEYHRDAKGRVTQIDEYVEGGPTPSVTTYTYGHGHLAAGELDADSGVQVEPNKYYYSWWTGLAGADYFSQGGDPNRLVQEVRTGESEYYREYRYDAGGNRLAKIEKQNVAPFGQPPDWRPAHITRYNYAFRPNRDLDPRIANGEPAFASGGSDFSYNSYTSLGAGQDKLLSYTEYLFDGDGLPVPNQAPVYTIYTYRTGRGMMGQRMSWDGQTRTQVVTTFTYRKTRLQSAMVEEITWPQDPEQLPDWFWMTVNKERFLEVYGYDIFGRRIGVMHSTVWGDGDAYPDAAFAAEAKASVKMYDYVDGRLLVERESNKRDESAPPRQERLISVYNWGAAGLISRRGVSVRDGVWDAQAEQFIDSDPPNAMCDYTYMSDHMGNIVGLVDSASGQARRQVFDAFGVNIGGYIAFRCASDHDWADWMYDPSDPPDPLPAAQPVERMQAGGLNWRGGEGSQTDRVLDAMQDQETYEGRWWAYTRPSTGLIYMQARYYEPQTGRFTQADAVPYGMEMAWGQNNRWTYCANDPVNFSDPTGLVPLLAAIFGITAAVIFSIGFALGLYDSGGSANGALQAILLVLLDIVLSTACSIAVGALASVLNPVALAFALLGAALLAVFFAGYYLGRFVGGILAFHEEEDLPQNETREDIEHSSQRLFYARGVTVRFVLQTMTTA